MGDSPSNDDADEKTPPSGHTGVPRQPNNDADE
jgi:hypothetical protein